MSDGKTILVVEDEKLLLEAITKKLQMNGYEVVECATAREALNYLEHDNPLPVAIWLDYYLPDMNGFEFVQKFKQNSAWEKVPVLVVSNSASEEKVEAMMALGVKKYLLKTDYRLDDLVKMLPEIIHDEEMQ
jgi:CheY-like chemotaxis protein